MISIVREFYVNLVDQALKRVWVRGKWVPFNSKTIKSFYNLPSMENEASGKLRDEPNYKEIIKFLTNDQEKWKVNSEGKVVNFKAKGLNYIPKVWHHFITSRILPTTNVCEVNRERVILNFTILHNIKFDVGMIIEEAIWNNRDAKKHLGYLS